MQNKPIKKLYYSISDVSRMTDLKQYILRHWESEFPELHPTKNRAGNRIYRLKEIKLLFLIKRLVYKEHFRFAGARKKLKEYSKDEQELESIQVDVANDQVKEIVKSIRQDLEELNQIFFKQVGA